MRILLVTIGSHGDIHPFLAIGRELLRRGHTPTILTNPTFRTLIESNGVAFEGLADEKSIGEQMRESPEVWDRSNANVNVIEQVVGPLLKPMYERVLECAGQGGADLVVLHHACFSALWAAEQAGVPAAVCVLAPFYWLSRHESLCDAKLGVLRPGSSKRWVARNFVRPLFDRKLDAKLNRARVELGLPDGKGWMKATTHGGVMDFGLWSPTFRGPLADDPATSVICGFTWHDEISAKEQANIDELNAYIHDGAPPILFSLGTAVVHVVPEFPNIVDEALGMLGTNRAILLTGPGGHGQATLKNVRCFPYAPFSRVMPRCAANVHHGGVGTTAQALRAGRPQIVLHKAHDQPDNGNRVSELGVGRSTSVCNLKAKRLAAELRKVLNEPSMVNRAAAVALQIRGERDGAEVAADAIEGYLNGRGRNRG